MNLSATKRAAVAIAVAGLLFSPGCKRAPVPEPAPSPTAEESPAPTPAPNLSKPSAIAQPPTETPTPTPARVVYVATAFQAMDEGGTHDFPVGAMVIVLGEEGDDYIVEYNGVSVRNARTFFSETVVEQIPASPTPAAPAFATPQTQLSDVAPSPVPAAPGALTSDSAIMEEDRQNSEKLDKIRALNSEIRTAQEKNQKAAAAKLKKQRDELSEELTRTAKP
ncbi:MAG: hypothetical protein ACOYMS_06885 [Terrimicrobiaceae bacterium]